MIRYNAKLWYKSFLQNFVSSNLDPSVGDQKFIFGLGTGRCGTSSLGVLLNMQPGCSISHELKPILSWNDSDKMIAKKINQIVKINQSVIRGDVASSYLPVVEKIIAILPNAKFVCLKRDKAATVKSFMNKTKRRNHWNVHNGEKWEKDYWDRFFPKYDTTTKEEAINQYWVEYYKISEELMIKYPNNFKEFPMKILSDLVMQEELFSFIGIENSTPQIVHSNSLK